MTCAAYSTNWLVFITEMKSVYSAVRTGSLNTAVCASSVKGKICIKTCFLKKRYPSKSRFNYRFKNH